MNQKTFFIGIIAYGVYIVVWYFVLKTLSPTAATKPPNNLKPDPNAKPIPIIVDPTIPKPPVIPGPTNPPITDPTKPVPGPTNPPITDPTKPVPGPTNPPITDPTKPINTAQPTAPASGRWQDCGGGITHTADKISGFCGPFQWLSNFEPAKVTYKGKEFKSVESAYHAAKYPDQPDIIDQFVPLDAVNAFKLSRTLPAYDFKAFDAIKLDLMRDLVGQKFAVDPLKSKLKATGQAKLEEYNWWGNKYWGLSPDGENWLGVILMETRSKL
jgi:predicted NAD-dependent protein-ADP-ribosyltransferase YbiA (DUF1768 family)